MTPTREYARELAEKLADIVINEVNSDDAIFRDHSHLESWLNSLTRELTRGVLGQVESISFREKRGT